MFRDDSLLFLIRKAYKYLYSINLTNFANIVGIASARRSSPRKDFLEQKATLFAMTTQRPLHEFSGNCFLPRVARVQLYETVLPSYLVL